MGGIALEVPLRLLAIVGRRQRHHAADPRIQPLGDALDHAALARGVAPLEHDDHLVPGVGHPVLQLHQLALQAEEFAEVALARRTVCLAVTVPAAGRVFQAIEGAVYELQLELFVVAVDQVAFDAVQQGIMIVGQWEIGHLERLGGEIDHAARSG
jgi:hypothetical protein